VSTVFDGLNALLLTRRWDHRLRVEGVTLPQLSIMDQLAGGAVMVTEIARSEGINHSVASATVTRLEYLGLVRRERGIEDQRQTFVALTKKGEKTLLRLADLAIADPDHDQE